MTDQEFQYQYALVSGRTVSDAIVVGHKFREDADFRSGEVESWTFTFTPNPDDTTTTDRGGKWSAYCTGIWQSDAGRVYASLAHGEVGIYDGIRSFNQLSLDKLGTALAGVWGLDDQHVYAYGGAPGSPGQVFRFDGSKWNKLPEAPEWLLHMHGCAPDCVYGVGQRSAYRWDGKQWHATSLRATLSLACVWVESPDQIWATDRGGVLFEGSADGWIERARFAGPLVGVARWRGDLWIGGEAGGLLRLTGTGNQIDVFSPKVPTRYFEARQDLLIPNDHRMVYSADGVKFRVFGKDSFSQLTENEPFGA